MFKRACLAMCFACFAPQAALADCWGGRPAEHFEFLWGATAEDVEECLEDGVSADVHASNGFTALFTMAIIGTQNDDGLEIIRKLVMAEGDIFYTPPGSRLNVIERASGLWGDDSAVVGALSSGDTKRTDGLTSKNSPSRVMWATERAIVRAGPDISSSKVGVLLAGDEVRVIAKVGNWFKLEPFGRQERFAYAPVISEVRPATRSLTSEFSRSKVMWAEKRANVRAGPDTNYAKVGLLEVGDEVRIIKKVGNWFKLEPIGGQERFVYSPLITEVRPEVRTLTYDNGARYHGQLRNGKPHGHGVLTWANGNRYEGDFVDGARTGRGVYTWANGDRYEGDFVDGAVTGRGVVTWGDSGNRYEGDFVDGARTGRGVYMWANGDRYEGDFVDGAVTGRGVLTWGDNGNRYEGDFVDGARTGRGVYTWANGDRYEGDFVDGAVTGRGVLTWGDNGNRYEGDFVDGARTGRGVYTWAYGNRYEGDFVDGTLTGHGVLTGADGARYEGEWQDGHAIDTISREHQDAWGAERLRRLQEEWDMETDDDGDSFADNFMAGVATGALIGSVLNGEPSVFDLGSEVSVVSSGCEDIGQRLARDLERIAANDSMCTIYRGTSEAYSRARNALAAAGCATSHELGELDGAIRQAEIGAREACG